MLIYRITNKVNGMCYIGQTVKTADIRFREHLVEAHRPTRGPHPFYDAICYYGDKNFEVDVLSYADSVDEMDALEYKFIKELDTLHPNGYNLKDGGRSNPMLYELGKQHHADRCKTQEFRDKVSKTMKRRRELYGFSEQTRKRISEALMGNTNSKGYTNKCREMADKARAKSVSAYSVQGVLVKSFERIKYATYWLEELGYHKKDSYISHAGGIKSSDRTGKPYCGFVWKYEPCVETTESVDKG